MLRWLAASALLCLLLVPTAFGQFNALLYYTPDPGNAALTTVCGGTTPLPDSRIIRIYWDVDSDGPDATDPVPTLCDDPPTCELGPSGTVTINQFTMNGTAVSLGAGYFWMETNFNAVAISPNPPRFYLRIYEADGTTVLWTSAVKVLGDGFQEVPFVRADWTCGGDQRCIVRDEHE